MAEIITLETGLMDFFRDRVYMTPRLSKIGEPKSFPEEFDPRFTGRDIKVRKLSVEGSPQDVEIECVDGADPAVIPLPFYRLARSTFYSIDGNLTFEKDVEGWLEGRVYTMPQILIAGDSTGKIDSSVSGRSYKFQELVYPQMMICSLVRFLDIKHPPESPIAFYNLLPSEQVPPEEAAKIVKEFEKRKDAKVVRVRRVGGGSDVELLQPGSFS